MNNPYFSKDTLELLTILDNHRVRYVIVGGEAVIFYGYSRVTGDIDLFYDYSESNTRNLYDAMLEFWGGDVPGINSAEEFMDPGVIIQFGQPPNRIDFLNSVDGISFSEAWESRLIHRIKSDDTEITVYYIGLEPLIKNKKASGRYKDMDDLRFLSRLKP
jgi:predicted nucleotidyltransferase